MFDLVDKYHPCFLVFLSCCTSAPPRGNRTQEEEEEEAAVCQEDGGQDRAGEGSFAGPGKF